MNLSRLPDLLASHPLTDEEPWFVAIDLALLRRRFSRLREVFPAWLHAVAVKAHPLEPSLRMLVGAGAGMEAASFGEVELALEAGCPPSHVVFDSPAKTRHELRRSAQLGLLVNADNLDELARIDELVDTAAEGFRVGLRVNPEVAPSTIGALSTGSRNSKFGVSLSRSRAEVEDTFRRYDWLDGLHVHIGSKGYGADELARAMVPVVELASAVGASRIDIGGGMPPSIEPDEYWSALAEHVPALLDSTFDVVTEFGRWVFAHCGLAVSRVEYVKPAADHDIATIHFGADFMLRNAYQPGVWNHGIEAFHPDGTRKFDAERTVTVAGPLCFGGDVIRERAELPALAEGDILVVRDVGAYTFGMWSSFCLRRYPDFLLVDDGGIRRLSDVALP